MLVDFTRIIEEQRQHEDFVKSVILVAAIVGIVSGYGIWHMRKVDVQVRTVYAAQSLGVVLPAKTGVMVQSAVNPMTLINNN
jgi:hypothetical protein